MAYINQDMKKIIQEQLKKVIPASWKWSLRINNHMSIKLTIQSAPVNLLKENAWADGYGNISINQYYLEKQYSGELLTIFENIHRAMKSANWYDKSDSMVDYFDTAYYINIDIGRWDKPFVVK